MKQREVGWIGEVCGKEKKWDCLIDTRVSKAALRPQVYRLRWALGSFESEKA